MRTVTKRIKDYTFPWYSDRELVLLFLPESKEIINEKVNEWEEACEEIKQDIREALEHAERVSKKDVWFVEILMAKLMLPRLYAYEKDIARLRRSLITPNGRRSHIENFQEKIEQARASPIYEVARDKLELRQSGKNFVALCPYHNEKTPSCYLYIETNTFYCFGCNEKGDVIKLTMDLHSLNFKEAIEYLQN